MLKKQNVVLYLILNFITFGIYGMFFWYRWTENVNTLCDGDEKDSANYLLVYILDWFTCGIYALVWNYQQGERLYQAADKYGVQIKHGGLFILLFRIFLAPVANAFKIINANKLIDAYNSNLTAEVSQQAELPEA